MKPLTFYCPLACLLACLMFTTNLRAGEDPWQQIQKRFKEQPAPKQEKKTSESDPWQELRAVFLPFSLEEETRAKTSKLYAKSFSKKFYSVLEDYGSIIETAAAEFHIPVEIISAVIMAESAGNSRAAAKTTTAKGLMQTIDATFAMARTGLSQRGISIADNPFDPEASIMAGSWYLDRMFEKAVQDGRIQDPDRANIGSWRYPLEYYYAGPSNGAKKENKIMVFSKGRRRVIDKRAYSEKIQTWAQILKPKEM